MWSQQTVQQSQVMNETDVSPGEQSACIRRTLLSCENKWVVVNIHTSCGIVPAMFVFSMEKSSRLSHNPRVVGMVPFNVLFSIDNCFRLTSCPISSPILPEKSFAPSSKYLRTDISYKLFGNSPLRPPFPSNDKISSENIKISRDQNTIRKIKTQSHDRTRCSPRNSMLPIL